MALFDTTWYVNFGNGTSTGHYAVAKRPQNTAVVAGQLCRQFTAPAVGSERVFVCIVAGTTANTTDATWATLRGNKVTDGTVTWQECTGASAVNGDFANTPTWSGTSGAPTLGAIIKRDNGASYQICSTAGARGSSEPAFSNTAGVTTVDGAACIWTCLGPVGNFTGGQAPHARLANALASTWFASGNTVYVGDNHAETASTGVAATSVLMARILCHNRSGSYPPAASDLATGASLTATSALGLALQGSFYVRGLMFTTSSIVGITIGQNASTGIHNWFYFDNCSFQVTGNTSTITVGNAAAATWHYVVFDNSTVKFSFAANYVAVLLAQLTWRNTGQVLASGSVVPTALFKPGGTNQSNFYAVSLEGLDLSQLTGSVYDGTQQPAAGSFLVKDCKLNATTGVIAANNTGNAVQLAASDSGATSYKSSRYTYEAVETTETSIVRTGGFVDAAGQAQSHKIVTTANTQWLRPYAAQPLAVWNAATGSSKIVTVYGTVNSGTLPTNDDIWLEVSGLTNASFPVGSTVTSGKANVWSAGSAGVSDSSTWSNTTGAETPSYSNSGGQGDRTGIITITTDLTIGGGTHGMLINGSEANEYWWGSGQTNKFMTFDFGIGVLKVINEITWTQDGANTHGSNQTFAGSNDNVSYTNLSTTVALGTSATTVVPITNTTGYRYYRLTIPGSTSSLPYIREIKFKIGSILSFTPFKLVATLTPQMPGYLIAQVKVAKASTTVYIDPLAVVT